MTELAREGAAGTDAVELLPVSLLDRHRASVERLRRLARELVIPLGWHYLIDLAWILDRLGPAEGAHVLDAGAGIGVLQWALAEDGAEVLSVDRSQRARLPLYFRRRFRVRGLQESDLGPPLAALSSPRGLVRSGLAWLRRPPGGGPVARGAVWLHHADLSRLGAVPDDSQDAVVSVSALEHNPPDRLEEVVAELLRVVKPGGVIIATLSAARDRDWFHEPSQGWCYTEATLRRAFRLSAASPSNYDRYDELFEALRGCQELRRGLALAYYRSGRNGMPWGRWDPLYQPVGVVKFKR